MVCFMVKNEGDELAVQGSGKAGERPNAPSGFDLTSVSDAAKGHLRSHPGKPESHEAWHHHQDR